MSPGAVWWGNFLFRDTWKVPAGRITAAAPLRWKDDSKPYTSSEGGGLWGFSRHIKGVQLQNTLTFARFVASDPRWQVDLSVGLPGYGPLQQAWLAKQRQAGYLAHFDLAAAAFVLATTIVRRLLRFLTLLCMVIPNTVLVIRCTSRRARSGRSTTSGSSPSSWASIRSVYLAYIHFKTALPVQMIEAARIDGMSEGAIFRQVALPLSKQAVALVAFFSFVADWTNFFLPLVLLPLTESATVSVGLQQLVSSSPLYDPTNAAGLEVRLYSPQLALATLVTIVPVLVVFVVAQRYLIRGQTLGALKG